MRDAAPTESVAPLTTAVAPRACARDDRRPESGHLKTRLSLARVRVMLPFVRNPSDSDWFAVPRACACDAAAGGDNIAIPLKSHLNAI